MNKSFPQRFDLVYKKYCSLVESLGAVPSILAFSRFLGFSNDGKLKEWKKGQPPSANDCNLLHEKLGFRVEWLLSGKGEPEERHCYDAPRISAKPAFAADPTAQDLAAKVHELEAIISSLRQELIDSQKESLALYRQRDSVNPDVFMTQTVKRNPPTGENAAPTASTSISAELHAMARDSEE